MENKDRSTEIEFDLLPLLKALVSKIWLMVIVGVLIAGVAFGATKAFIKPTYRCGFTAYVNNQHTQGSTDTLSMSDLNAAKQLVETYIQIIRSNTILNAAADSINADLSFDNLQKKVSAEVRGETEVIAVYVVDEDPQTAYILANAIAKTAPTYMSQIVEGSSMKIIDYPMYNDNRYTPNYTRYTLLGFLIGVLIIAVQVIVSYFRDDTIKSEREIEERFDIPILGAIPDVIRSAENAKKGYAYNYTYQQRKTSRGGEKK